MLKLNKKLKNKSVKQLIRRSLVESEHYNNKQTVLKQTPLNL